MTSSRRDAQTLLLPSGLQLGFAEYGPTTGRPLFYFHGFPSSRLEGEAMEDLAVNKGVRLICPDRPGMGLSTLRAITSSDGTRRDQFLYQMTEYPSMILSLADHLNLPSFSVLGASGGGPFALACAATLPSHRLNSVGLLASGGPWMHPSRTSPISSTNALETYPPILPDQAREPVPANDLQRDVMWSSYITSRAITHFPTATTALTDGMIRAMRWISRTKAFQNWFDRWMATQQEKANIDIDDKADTAYQSRSSPGEFEAEREKAYRIILEAFRQGSQGAIHDARLLTSDWMIKSENVNPDLKVRIWHGTKDINAPINQIRFMAQRIPGCMLTEWDCNHFGVAAYLEAVLDELVPPHRSDKLETDRDTRAVCRRRWVFRVSYIP